MTTTTIPKEKKAGEGGEVLEAALKYAERGWRVIPVRPNKIPHIKKWQDRASTDPTQVRRWWTKWPNANVGIATGAGSGIFVIDVDPQHGGNESLAELEAAHGPLPETVEAITGRGGRHIFFAIPPGLVVRNSIGTLADGVDIRGEGGFVVAAPSLHQFGRQYEWNVEFHPDDRKPTPAPDWLLELVTESTERDFLCVLSVTTGLTLSVTEAIRETLPVAEGQRHKCLFRFVQRLKGMPEYADRPGRELKNLVKEWHRQALPTIGTKAFDETWSDFLSGWDKVKFAYGLGPINRILAATDASPDPEFAADYDPDTRRLIRLCIGLQRHAGEKPFPLSCRVASRLIGWNHMTANRRISMLCKCGVLELVELGDKGGRCEWASRFRYRGDEIESAAEQQFAKAA